MGKQISGTRRHSTCVFVAFEITFRKRTSISGYPGTLRRVNVAHGCVIKLCELYLYHCRVGKWQCTRG